MGDAFKASLGISKVLGEVTRSEEDWEVVTLWWKIPHVCVGCTPYASSWRASRCPLSWKHLQGDKRGEGKAMFLSKCHFNFPWVGTASSGTGAVQVVGWGGEVLVRATSAPRRAGGWSGPAARRALHRAVDVQEQSRVWGVAPRAVVSRARGAVGNGGAESPCAVGQHLLRSQGGCVEQG